MAIQTPQSLGDKASSRGPGPAEDDVPPGVVSERQEEQDFSPAAAGAADETVEFEEEDFEEDYDEDPFIWNLNMLRRHSRTLTPEWIEETKKQHYEYDALLTEVYLDMDNDDYEKDTEEDKAAFKEWIDQLSETAQANLASLNIAGGESCGVDAVGVYFSSQLRDLDAPAADASSSQDDTSK